MTSQNNNLSEFPPSLPPLSAKQKQVSNVLFCIGFILFGIFLLLCGLNIVPLKVTSAIVPGLFVALAVIFFILGILQTNNVLIFMACIFAVVAAVSIIEIATTLTYAKMYPLYISSPGIAALITIPFTKTSKSDLLKAAAIFAFLGAVFFLTAFKIFTAVVTMPVLIVFGGLVLGYIVFKSNKSKNE